MKTWRVEKKRCSVFQVIGEKPHVVERWKWYVWDDGKLTDLALESRLSLEAQTAHNLK